jgi:hypothetical protein
MGNLIGVDGSDFFGEAFDGVAAAAPAAAEADP